VNLDHVSLPVVFSGECFATCSGIITAGDRAVEFLLLLVPVINVSLKMCLGAEALATARVRALVVFAMVSLVMSKARGLNTFLSNDRSSKQ
jgi:hypothetical protein